MTFARSRYPADAQTPGAQWRQVVRAFEEAGWRQDRQRGSHVVMLLQGSNVSLSIPQHRTIAPGTLRALIRLSGMTVDEFRQLL